MPQKDDDDKMLTKRQQQVLKAMVDGGNGDKYPNGSFANSPTPKGEALAALLDETTTVTRRGGGMVIS